MTAAAENPNGGGAADGMGLGLGFAMAGRMMQPGMMGGAPGMGGPGMASPPPPPMAAWHVAVNGQTQGPFSPQQIASGVASGEVKPDTLVWSNGMAGWLAAGQVPQLQSYFAGSAPPPPLPPGL